MLAALVIALLSQAPDPASLRGPIFSSPARTGHGFRDHTGGPAQFTFAPLNGAGMPTACSTTAPTMRDGTAITFSRASVGECTSTDGQTITQLATGLPRVMAGTIDDPVLGLMNEGHTRTNYAWRGHDLSNATWVKSSMTCTLTATGLRGAANSASVCTATGAGGTVTQTVSFTGSHEGSTSMYLKRITGSGAVQVSIDGTVFLADVSGSLSSSLWKRYGPNQMVGCTAGTSSNSYTGSLCIVNASLHQTLANPVVKIKLATSGDAIAVDFVQHEEGPNATSPIETTGDANAVRAAELADMPITFAGGGREFCAAATVVVPSAGLGVFLRIHGVPGDGTLGGADSTKFDDSYYNGGAYQVEFTAGGPTYGLATGLSFGSDVRVRSSTLYTPVQILGCLNGSCTETVSAAVGPLDTWTRYRLGGFNAINGAFDGVIKNVEFDPVGATCQRFLNTAPASYGAAFGDSITCCPNGSAIGWPHYANITYGGTRQVANYGVGSTHTSDALAAWTSYARRKRYNYIFVLSGTNDVNDGISIATIEANLQTIFQQAITDGLHVFPITLLPRGNSAGWTAGNQTNLETVNTWIRSYCTGHHLTCIDAYNSALRTGTALAAIYDVGDGLHPNVAGETYLAGLVTAAAP